MNKKNNKSKVTLSNSGLSPTNKVLTHNHLGEEVDSKVAGELPP